MWFTYNGVLLSHPKKETLPFATTWMERGGIIVSEKGQTEQDKYGMISLTCEISNQQTQRRTSRLRVTRGGVGGGEINVESVSKSTDSQLQDE